MKKKLSYRDKLVELAYIYDVREIKEYEKSRKNLTTGQLELILKKNKIIIPKDYKSNFFRDTFVKPISKAKSNLSEFKEKQVKTLSENIFNLEKDIQNIKNEYDKIISNTAQQIEEFVQKTNFKN